jgi:hypothetical protein
MQTILDANESIILPIESRLIVHLRKKYLHINKWSSEILDELIIDLYKDKKFAHYWAVNPVNLRKSIDELPIEELNFQVICKVIYLNYPSPFKKGRIHLLGDKNPIYSIFTKELYEVFPDAKFVHLIRDYRDNIVSNRTVFKRQNVAQLALGWKLYNSFIEKRKKNNTSRFYTLKYEDLVAEPSKFVPELCDFLNISFNPEMLQFYSTIQKVKEEKYTAEINLVHPNIIKPINTAQVEKWKKGMTEKEIELADYIAGEYAAKYGYIRQTHVMKLKFPFQKLAAFLRISLDIFIIRTYYGMPFVIRDNVGKLTTILYKKFNLTTYYNNADFRFKE